MSRTPDWLAFPAVGREMLERGIPYAIPAAFVFWFILRRGAILSFRVVGAITGMLAGLVSTTVLEVHCPNLNVWEVLIWHFEIAFRGRRTKQWAAMLFAIRNAVEAMAPSEKVSLTFSDTIRNGNQIKFHLMSTNLRGGDSTATVYAALAEGKVQSNVGGGENGGRSLTHVAVVRVLAPMGTLKGGARCQKTSSCRYRPACRPIAFVS